jgi:hypothetical protein
MNWERREIIEALIRIGHLRLAFWFVGLGLLATVPLQLVFAWRGNAPGSGELLLRLLLCVASFGTAMTVFLWLVFRAGKPWK